MDTYYQPIVQYKIEHPTVAASTIAKVFGLSRQNVHYIITKARKKNSNIPLFKRNSDGKDYISICKYCGKQVVNKKNKLVSHRNCFRIHVGYMQLKCPICSTKFPIKKSQYRYRLDHGQKQFFDKRECLFKSLSRRRK